MSKLTFATAIYELPTTEKDFNINKLDVNKGIYTITKDFLIVRIPWLY